MRGVDISLRDFRQVTWTPVLLWRGGLADDSLAKQNLTRVQILHRERFAWEPLRLPEFHVFRSARGEFVPGLKALKVRLLSRCGRHPSHSSYGEVYPLRAEVTHRFDI